MAPNKNSPKLPAGFLADLSLLVLPRIGDEAKEAARGRILEALKVFPLRSLIEEELAVARRARIGQPILPRMGLTVATVAGVALFEVIEKAVQLLGDHSVELLRRIMERAVADALRHGEGEGEGQGWSDDLALRPRSPSSAFEAVRSGPLNEGPRWRRMRPVRAVAEGPSRILRLELVRRGRDLDTFPILLRCRKESPRRFWLILYVVANDLEVLRRFQGAVLRLEIQGRDGATRSSITRLDFEALRPIRPILVSMPNVIDGMRLEDIVAAALTVLDGPNTTNDP